MQSAKVQVLPKVFIKNDSTQLWLLTFKNSGLRVIIAGALLAHLPLQLPQQTGQVRTQEERLQSEAQGGREAVRLLSTEVPQEVSLGEQPQRRLRRG